MAQAAVHTTTDHREIKRWAEAHDGRPSAVKRTGKNGDPGILRIDFPGFSGEGSLRELSWDDWFKWFDKNSLALVYRDSDRFNKLIARDTAAARARGQRTSRRTGQPKTTRGRRATAKTTARKPTPARRGRAAKSSSGRRAAGAGTGKRRASGRARTVSRHAP